MAKRKLVLLAAVFSVALVPAHGFGKSVKVTPPTNAGQNAKITNGEVWPP